MDSSNPDYVSLVQEDFSVLSKSYDLINNFMSLGTDRQFRYIAIKNSIPEPNRQTRLISWLDIGTGTGHLADELYRQKGSVYVVGMDVSKPMLEYAKQRRISKDGSMDLVLGDAAKTPFRNKSLDAGMSGFVGRHFTNYPNTLSEHQRIIRPRGRLMMLEMGRKATPLAPLIDVYVGRLMTVLGKLASFVITRGTAPFRLLEETYARFFSPKELVTLFDEAGFKSRSKLVLFGSIVVILAYRLPGETG